MYCSFCFQTVGSRDVGCNLWMLMIKAAKTVTNISNLSPNENSKVLNTIENKWDFSLRIEILEIQKLKNFFVTQNGRISRAVCFCTFSLENF